MGTIRRTICLLSDEDEDEEENNEEDGDDEKDEDTCIMTTWNKDRCDKERRKIPRLTYVI